ncbi:MAG: hypothetical protein RLZZ28_2504 [Bacteroidota bacterium]
MRIIQKIILFAGMLIIAGGLIAQPSKKKPLSQIIDSALLKAVAQYKYLGDHLPAGQLPQNYNPLTKKLQTSNSSWWCSGFYPGSLLYLYEYSKDNSLLTEAEKVQKLLEKEQFNKGTHDLGFMMYCSFGNANRLKQDKANESILLNSAKSLSTRFNPAIGCIKSWDHGKWNYPVIIDNMMNLELLFWATKYTGDSSYYKIAVTHANTTMKNHFRPDYSSYHVVDYAADGKLLARVTHQGYADYSSWARGQAWGLYGYVVMYRCTKDPKYLTHANKIAQYILTHPSIPEDKIPFWDYHSPEIPATYRDASAAAITASALLELSRYAGSEKSGYYVNYAEKIIRSLSSPTYTAPYGENGGFLLKHGTGHLPGNSEIDVALSYGDYYYIEALMRYKALKTQ